MIKNILIIGSSGFIGKNLLKKLYDESINVIRIENSVNKLKNDFNYKSYLWSDLESTFILKELKKLKLDLIINLAWSGASGENRSCFITQMKNLEISKNAITLAEKLNIKKYFGIGSIMEDEMYLDVLNSNINYNKIYGLAKYNDHIFSKQLCNQKKINFYWLTITNTFGPGECSERLINTIIKNNINCISMHFSSATQLYSFIYIDDLINLIFVLLYKAKQEIRYIIGDDKPKILKDYINTIYNILPNKISPIFDNKIQSSLNINLLDAKNTFNDTNYHLKYTFEEGIKLTLDFWKEKNCENK